GVLEMVSGNRELGEDWLFFGKTVGSQIGQAIELSRTLAQLSASEQRHRELIQGLDAIVWEAATLPGPFTFVSDRAEQLLGYPAARWLGEPTFWADHLHPDDRDRTLAHFQTALIRKQDQTVEYRMLSADSRVVWLYASISVVLDVEGQPRQLRGIMVDVTK